jgi:Domain of unknown function (DUF4124)
VLSNVFVSVSWVMSVVLSGNAMAQGIYTCVDGRGRKITSDRQIAECSDRTQHELSPSGAVKRVLGPAPTERELAAQDDKDRLDAAVRAREQEDKRRARALLLRYPNRASHDKERELALLQVDDLIGSAGQRTQELASQRTGINADFEFYKKDPSKAPAALVRRRDENDSSMAGQKRHIAEQTQEKQRINAHFDEELAKLQQLWAMANAPLTGVSASSPRATSKN